MQLLDFLGDWRFDRTVHDAQGTGTGQVTGVARIAGDAVDAVYFETGEMTLPGQPPIRAERRYLWRAVPAGIATSFDDGRDFHLIDLSGAAATASHWCDPDDYRVAYDFSAWPIWTSDWRVTGPRKDYRLLTSYKRT